VAERPRAERIWPGVVLVVCGLVGALGRAVEIQSDGPTGLAWVGVVAFVAMALTGVGSVVSAVRARRRSAQPEARRPAR
jgi:hypothetical protein